MYDGVEITGYTITNTIALLKTPHLPLHRTQMPNIQLAVTCPMALSVIAVYFPGLAHPSVAFIHMASPINKPGHSSKFNLPVTAHNTCLATRYSIHKYRCDMRGYCWHEG
jgi:hypothetical protein